MNKLYKSRTNRVVAGVAGGLGRYLRVDPVLIRLFFGLLALSDGIGLVLYLILAVVMPAAPESEAPLEGEAATPTERGRDTAVIGGGLILLGGYFLLRTLDISFIPWFSLSQLWPLLLIVAGLSLLWRQRQDHPIGG